MSAELPEGVERDRPLARLTTVRAGGAADLFARPESGRARTSSSPTPVSAGSS
jgi:hypothetical protein